MISKHFLKTFFGFIGMIALGLIVLFFIGKYTDQVDPAPASADNY